MRIRITTTFTDKQAEDQDNALVEAGSEITVTAERGAELVGLGLAEEIGGSAATPPRRRRARKAAPLSSAVPPAPSSAPSVASTTDLDPAAQADAE